MFHVFVTQGLMSMFGSEIGDQSIFKYLLKSNFWRKVSLVAMVFLLKTSDRFVFIENNWNKISTQLFVLVCFSLLINYYQSICKKSCIEIFLTFKCWLNLIESDWIVSEKAILLTITLSDGYHLIFFRKKIAAHHNFWVSLCRDVKWLLASTPRIPICVPGYNVLLSISSVNLQERQNVDKTAADNVANSHKPYFCNSIQMSSRMHQNCVGIVPMSLHPFHRLFFRAYLKICQQRYLLRSLEISCMYQPHYLNLSHQDIRRFSANIRWVSCS